MDTGLLQSIDQQTRLAGYNRLALLLFSLGGRATFAINVFKVREVIPRPQLTAVPGAHPLVHGVMDFRGQVLPVLDLARALDQAPGADADYVVITEFNRSQQGFLVNGVERILHVDVADVMPPDAGDGFLTAMTRHDNRTVQIVDVERVLADVTRPLAGVISSSDVSLGRGWRALVADDSQVARSQVTQTLTALGLSCVAVPDGARALEWLRAQAAASALGDLALVVSDVEMPRLDGYALTSEIRRDPALSGLFVLLHTSLSGVSNRAMVERVGADRFITKFSPEELSGAIRERLQALTR
jgi:two-component system chemotaxis response regulator CheV